MGVGRPCPPVRNDIVTPRHLLVSQQVTLAVGWCVGRSVGQSVRSVLVGRMNLFSCMTNSNEMTYYVLRHKANHCYYLHRDYWLSFCSTIIVFPLPFLSSAQANVVLGTNMAVMEKPQIESLLLTHKEIVFSRITPMQKLEIVEACQRLGVIVAATGNCINDIPALKQADVGVGLGLTGE